MTAVTLNVASAAFTLAALTLTLLGAIGWRRSKRPKTLVLTLGFALFAAAGGLSTWWLFNREDLEPLLTYHLVLTSLGLLAIYVATVKR